MPALECTTINARPKPQTGVGRLHMHDDRCGAEHAIKFECCKCHDAGMRYIHFVELPVSLCVKASETVSASCASACTEVHTLSSCTYAISLPCRHIHVASLQGAMTTSLFSCLMQIQPLQTWDLLNVQLGSSSKSGSFVSANLSSTSLINCHRNCSNFLGTIPGHHPCSWMQHD